MADMTPRFMRWLSSAEELDAWAVSVVATVSVASYSAGDTPAATEFNQVFNKARWLVVRILPRYWNKVPLISFGMTGMIKTCTFHSCPEIRGCTGIYCTAS